MKKNKNPRILLVVSNVVFHPVGLLWEIVFIKMEGNRFLLISMNMIRKN